MTFTELKEVNNGLKTIDVKDKDYVQVNQRVLAFRQLFPMGRIETLIVNFSADNILIQATAKDENGVVLATGLAYEEKTSSFINKSSYVENCETSAVGRCLGFLGIGVDASICSKEEVENAKLQQEKAKTGYITELAKDASPELVDRYIILKDELKVSIEKILSLFNVNDINKCTVEMLDKAIRAKRQADENKAQKNGGAK